MPWRRPGGHSLALGPVEEIPYLKTQQRLLFARAGITRPLSLDDYRAHGGFAGLEAAVALDGAEVVAAVLDSGLRGRGGAAFPAGIKWRTVRDAGPGRNTWCATPTRATPAPLPTAC
jgi:formate dehydrogenase iron-sulfur subunit